MGCGGSTRKTPRLGREQQKRLVGAAGECAQVLRSCLGFSQRGEQHDAAKVLKGFGGAGVLEVIEDDPGGTFRAVYTVKFKEAVFVLHVFQNKSKRGIATPDMNIIRERLKVAEQTAREMRNEKAKD